MNPEDWLSPTVAQRHAAKTDRTGGPDACWPWTGTHNRAGYGHLATGVAGHVTTVKAHRVAWVLVYGSIPDELTIDHRCFTPDCQNVRHMELVTRAENARRQQPRTTRKNYAQGERLASAKLTDEAVRYIRRHYRFRKVTHQHLAALFGVSEDTIARVARGERWTHVEDVA